MSYGLSGVSLRLDGTLALDHVSFQCELGRTLAVVGGDGAGKTTALRTLVGIVPVTDGTVQRPERQGIGFVPARAGVYDDLTVDENIAFVAAVYGMTDAQRQQRARHVLERTNLGDMGGRLVGALSGGMRRKLAVGLALLHEPQLLVIDEPTTGVDPRSRVEIWRLLAAAAAGGAAVVLSTAYLDEAERCGSVVVLDSGRVRRAGTPDSVRASVEGVIVESVLRPETVRRWQRGARWRAWYPDSAPKGTTRIAPDLEDAVIVAALQDER
jgi:ABC-2 type transport system ATP-binding protein